MSSRGDLLGQTRARLLKSTDVSIDPTAISGIWRTYGRFIMTGTRWVMGGISPSSSGRTRFRRCRGFITSAGAGFDDEVSGEVVP